jgi:tRNA threonylcarbamoyladenosine biosynthesis protein TsaE
VVNPAAADVSRVVVERDDVDLEGMADLGACLAHALLPGDVVLLVGPLGSGKTALVREIARALGVTDTVRSPSFTIANVYAGPVTVNHLDLYRLDVIGAEDALALEEYVRPEVITLIEWPEAGAARLGRAAWLVELDHETATTRRMVIRAQSTDAAARWGSAEGSG